MEALLLQIGGPLGLLAAFIWAMRRQVDRMEVAAERTSQEIKALEQSLLKEIKATETGFLAEVQQCRDENRRLEGRIIKLETARELSDRETNRRLEAIEHSVAKMDARLSRALKQED